MNFTKYLVFIFLNQEIINAHFFMNQGISFLRSFINEGILK